MGNKRLGWIIILASTVAHAQGMLPGARTATSVAVSSNTSTLLVGQTVSPAVSVQDDTGSVRALMSFKMPTDVMAIFFVSPTCSASLKDFARFYQKYHDWRVAFLAVSPNPKDSMASVKAQLERSGLKRVAIAQDVTGALTRHLQPRGVPSLVILDEMGILRYRGIVRTPAWRDYAIPSAKRADADAAMANIIGHVDPVVNPEPDVVPECPLP